MLKVRGLNAFYGKSHILHDLSLEVHQGELVGLFGRNGMGKTTILKSIMGIVPPVKAEILFDGTPLQALPPYRIPRLGIGYVPQGRHIFPKFTVLENLKIALVDRRPQKEELDLILDYFPILKDRIHQAGGTLSGGEQQMLSIARALISGPKLILFDEPTEGLMPLIIVKIVKTIQEIHGQGVSILLVEQNIKVAKQICQRVYIIEKGSIVWSGDSQELDQRKDVQLRYLGLKVEASDKRKV